MDKRLLVVFMLVGIFCVVESQRNIFESSCPMGCADSTCFMSVGCMNCRPGWCRMFTRRIGSYCVMQCPRGMECMTSFGSPFCTRSRRT